jgi:hypothetical protein
MREELARERERGMADTLSAKNGAAARKTHDAVRQSVLPEWSGDRMMKSQEV